MKLKTKIIGSKVHEVGYRVFLLREALNLGMERFNAYNIRENGNQVLFALLDGEEEQISAFRSFIRKNRPENAEVSDILFEDYKGHVIRIEDYMHLIQVEQLSKGVPAILSIDRKQDQMLGKLDETRTEIAGEIREMRMDLRSYLDNKLIKIEHDIELIKEKIGLLT